MCDQHSTVLVKTRKEGTDRWCLRHRFSAPSDPCPKSTGGDDWCLVHDVEVWHQVGIDECIAPIVEALNQAEVFTLASCCGHGNQPGSIVLRDGRELRVHDGKDEG